MSDRPIVVAPGEGHRVGNVEFLARTADTPRFTLGIIDFAPGRELVPARPRRRGRLLLHPRGRADVPVRRGARWPAPGTYVLIPPGVQHGFRNDSRAPCGCSTSTPRRASTGASAWPTSTGRFRTTARYLAAARFAPLARGAVLGLPFVDFAAARFALFVGAVSAAASSIISPSDSRGDPSAPRCRASSRGTRAARSRSCRCSS